MANIKDVVIQLQVLGQQGITKASLKMAALSAAIALTTKVIGESIKAGIEYTAVLSKVGAVSGASAKDMLAFNKQARELGETTQKSASDVAKLQLELSKLGFKPKQIREATEAILDLSIASGEDLAQSATVAASTIKAFNLNAEDSAKVVDIMAKSFSSSGLDLEKFQVAMGYVGAAAQASNIPLSKATAILGTLVDRGIEASSAGTAVRRMLLENAKAGRTYEEGLNLVANSTNKLKTAADLYGATAANQVLILADNQAATDKLTTSLEGSTGAASVMAKIMGDNLAGDMKKAESATEAVYLSIFDRLEPSLREAASSWGKLLKQVNSYIKVSPADAIAKERDEVNKLFAGLSITNLSEEERKGIIEQLNIISPDLVEGLNAESLSLDTAATNLKKYNEESVTRIILAKDDVEVQKSLEEQAKTRMDGLEAEIPIREHLLALGGDATKSTLELIEARQEQIKGDESYSNELKNLGLQHALLTQYTNLNTEAAEKSKRLMIERKKDAELLSIATDKNSESIKDNTNATNDNTDSKLKGSKRQAQIELDAIKDADARRKSGQKLLKADIDFTTDAKYKALQREYALEKDASKKLNLLRELNVRAVAIRRWVAIDNTEKNYALLLELAKGDAKKTKELEFQKALDIQDINKASIDNRRRIIKESNSEIQQQHWNAQLTLYDTLKKGEIEYEKFSKDSKKLSAKEKLALYRKSLTDELMAQKESFNMKDKVERESWEATVEDINKFVDHKVEIAEKGYSKELELEKSNNERKAELRLESLSREHEQIREIEDEFRTSDAEVSNEHFDETFALLEEHRQTELDAVVGHKELTKAVNEKYDKLDIKNSKDKLKAENDINAMRWNAKMGLVNAMASASQAMFADTQAGEKAALAVSKGAAIAQIWVSNAIANAKAVAAFPLTGGLPFTAINTATAAVNTAGVVAQAARGMANISAAHHDKGSKAKTYKFENGGVVGGESYTGDNVVAHVNSGEVILNSKQQANLLFDKANGVGKGSTNGMSKEEMVDVIVRTLRALPITYDDGTVDNITTIQEDNARQSENLLGDIN